jgi:class 3 adenylate cyclase
MGMNSGEVIVGKIGDDLRMDYTAQGQVVGLAARMEQIAEPGKAHLTQHTADLVRSCFELRDLGETPLKGIAQSVRVYEPSILCERAALAQLLSTESARRRHLRAAQSLWLELGAPLCAQQIARELEAK